jgi:hypothetical protein
LGDFGAAANPSAQPTNPPGHLAPGSFVNLERLTAVRFSRGDGGEVTASCETVGGLSRRYEGEEARALREALQALCCHGTGAEWAR